MMIVSTHFKRKNSSILPSFVTRLTPIVFVCDNFLLDLAKRTTSLIVILSFVKLSEAITYQLSRFS